MIKTAYPQCRFCGQPLQTTFIDLGMQPPCESYLKPEQLNQKEDFYPLHVYVCENCFLVQLEEYVSPERIFREYLYFSSYSDTWLRHAKNYVDLITEKLNLTEKSKVVEIASNDGYLLQYFVKKGIPVLGVEPAANVAKVAIERGIPTVVDFFGPKVARELAAKGMNADLIIGNNVLAQVPALNEFVEAMKTLLNPSGVITAEFPHLRTLVDNNEFDTIYHEHYSYFSFTTIQRVFDAHGLSIFDVEKLPTHGGSLRIYACHTEDTTKPVTLRVTELKAEEETKGFSKLKTYLSFSEKVKETKRDLLSKLIDIKRKGKSIVGYGAPGKGNTLLNYCGIFSDFIDYVVDRSPYKQGMFLPGTHIPILNPRKISETKPDYVLVLPWNFKDEIFEQLSYIGNWGGRFLTPIPDVKEYTADGVEVQNLNRTEVPE